MNPRWLWTAGWCALLAAAPATAGPAGPPPFKPAAEPLDAAALAARVDGLLAADWDADKVKPAAPADDAEFCRRVYLDLAGRTPTVREIRDFLKDGRSDKRARLIDALLDGPRYVVHFTNVWRNLMLPEANASLQARALTPGFEAWLRKELSRNAGYDDMVRDILNTPVAGRGPRGGFAPFGGDASPQAYYLAKELKPENLAGGTARLFLGVKIECAQCHNHPFGDWKREQFWGYAAFFAGIQGQTQGDFTVPTGDDGSKHQLTIPGTNRSVSATFLDGKQPEWDKTAGGRESLARWITAPDNPYFARAAANRIWFYYFGAGLTDPVDEMVGGQGVASHPAVLDELAGQFAAHNYDLKYLLRAVALTRAYQLSSRKSDDSQDEPRHFARMQLRGLTPEQLFDSVSAATGYVEQAPTNARGFVVFGGGGSPRDEFVSRFANQSDRPTEVTTSILQALALMNGRLIGDATSLERSETLTAVLDAPFMDTREKIETLYLAALSRKPKDKELTRLVKYVEDGGAYADAPARTPDEKDKRYKQALADVFWALLNSGEFYLNH
jgi:hypothetical protein